MANISPSSRYSSNEIDRDRPLPRINYSNELRLWRLLAVPSVQCSFQLSSVVQLLFTTPSVVIVLVLTLRTLFSPQRYPPLVAYRIWAWDVCRGGGPVTRDGAEVGIVMLRKIEGRIRMVGGGEARTGVG